MKRKIIRKTILNIWSNSLYESTPDGSGILPSPTGFSDSGRCGMRGRQACQKTRRINMAVFDTLLFTVADLIFKSLETIGMYFKFVGRGKIIAHLPECRCAIKGELTYSLFRPSRPVGARSFVAFEA